jgi:hypothetical protein
VNELFICHSSYFSKRFDQLWGPTSLHLRSRRARDTGVGPDSGRDGPSRGQAERELWDGHAGGMDGPTID